ncbi:hypothetical protein B1R94_17665 [Mycolicibacterium litorale]|nr:hypothetical protein B1R94_17665 [Mycolicibacterium litorale]
MSLTLDDIERWDDSSISAVARAAAEQGSATSAAADQLGVIMNGIQWEGHAADAVRAAMWRTRLEMYRHADECESIAAAITRSAARVAHVKDEWERLQDFAASWDFQINQRSGAVSWTVPFYASEQRRCDLEAAGRELVGRIDKLIHLADRVDAELAQILDGTQLEADVRALGFDLDPRTPEVERDAERRSNQTTAFRELLGREPRSAADWDTAAALDPHSYSAKNDGVAANIVVGRIRPIPGQGVVRTNLFIPGVTAWTPFGDNLGDGRGFDPMAGPEQSRVSFYLDYENGIVLARQNPSVMPGTGVRTGSPNVKVSQNSNGSVQIDYRAADPFSPGGEGVAKSSPWNVNGRLVFKPTDAGPIAGGVVSDFPAIEIYNDRGGATTLVDRIMPLNIGPVAPFLGLPLSQQLGPGLMGEFPDESHPPERPVIGQRVPMPPVAPIPPYPSAELRPVGEQRVAVLAAP